MRREPRAARSTVADLRVAPTLDTRTTEQQIADLDREIEEWHLRQEIEKRRGERGDPSTGPSIRD